LRRATVAVPPGQTAVEPLKKIRKGRKRMKTVNDKLAVLSEARRQRIETRVAELAAEEMSLRALRRAHRLTQARVGRTAQDRTGWCVEARRFKALRRK
jgi:hypothetical protein